jgi:acetyl-CoA carboxylase biotin carboxylase subunit
MFKKILIANRSEIACRVIRACKELGISTVAVYSDADKDALHVRLADEAVNIGQSQALQSYLNHDAVINAAITTGSDAIHPGYGFLSEKWEFNQKVRDSGLTFIGAEPEPMKLLGSKVQSRITMIEAGVPVIPGMKSSSTNIDDFIAKASEIGYPVLIKASDGGGGKGMRVVRSEEEIASAVESAIRESKSAFGSEVVFLEKYIEAPRHIEFQVAGDDFGNAVHLFERECSIQRRHQKIIEETPSTALNDELRMKMGSTAVNVIKAAGYTNVGTVEFLLDKDNNFYFLEVNTRIQVEHPVTEMVTGIDLVKLQISIAAGEKIPFTQSDLSQRGHSIECRIYAEDGDNNFMPSSGKILLFREPKGPGVRYDCGIYEGYEVPVFYDPILAKLIVWGKDREEAITRMLMALKDNVILGVKTSNKFMQDVLNHQDFREGKTFTNFIESHSDDLFVKNETINDLALLAAAQFSASKKSKTQSHAGQSIRTNPWTECGRWELSMKSGVLS